jgi:hypothetical protein
MRNNPHTLVFCFDLQKKCHIWPDVACVGAQEREKRVGLFAAKAFWYEFSDGRDASIRPDQRSPSAFFSTASMHQIERWTFFPSETRASVMFREFFRK